MQERMVFDGPPIAAEERSFAEEIQSTGDVAAATAGHHKQNLVGHRRADPAEEASGEVGSTPLAAASIHVELEEAVPVLLLDVGPGQPVELDPLFPNRGALLSEVLSLGRGEFAQKLIEAL